jgi:hypothetical protein
MIKLIDILNEIVDASGIWYHGSTADINQSDLDPLYRESEKYKGDTDKQKWSKTGSSGGGVGIYFGSNKTEVCPTCPMQYTGFDQTAAPYTQGFMYEMRLKSEAKVINRSDLHNIGKNAYDQLRQEGVDALISGNELNVLNPDAIKSFKKIMQWKKVPALYPLIRGKRGEIITFDDNQSLENYLKKELGEYKLYKAGDKQIYLSTSNPDGGKGFEYVEDRKWFTNINESKNTIQYTKPNFAHEWNEAERYPEFQEMGKEKWVQLAQQGYVTKLAKIKSLLSNVDLDWDNLENSKKERFEKAFERGKIEMPIAVQFGKDEYDLVAGNTRIAGLVKNHIDPSIWIVKL